MNRSDTLVCIPVTHDELASLAVGETLACPRVAFMASPELYTTFDLGVRDDEEAEYAAFLMAGLWGLIHHGERLVLIADVSAVSPHPDSANGAVTLVSVDNAHVRAYFTDDVEETPIGVDLAGSTLDDAWESDQVQHMLATRAMAWHDVSELGR